MIDPIATLARVSACSTMILPCGCFAYRTDGTPSDIHGNSCRAFEARLRGDSSGDAVIAMYEERNLLWRIRNPWPL